MTIEEAINDLKDFIDTYLTCHGEEDTIAVSLDNVDVEAFHMAIKALEQEPILDKIVTEVKALFKEPAYYIPNYDAYKKVLEIINKCKAESEDKE